MLVTALSRVYQWFQLGIHLGLSEPGLKTIEVNNRRDVEMCMVEMLAMWLTGPDEKRSKHFLQRALQRLTPQPVLLPDTSGEYIVKVSW